MAVNILPQLANIYANDSIKFIGAVYNICRNKIDFLNDDIDNWRILINFYRLFVSWFVPLLIIFGEMGTLMCLIVLLRRRTGNTETRMWFVALSVADMYSLAVGLSMMYSSRLHFIYSDLMKDWPANHWDMRHSSSINCYLLNGMVYFGLLVSTWIQVGISVLRVLSVKANTPTRGSIQRRNFSVALSICVLSTLVVTFLLIGLSIEYRYPKPCPLYKMCVIRSGVNRYFFYVSLTIKVIFPTIILFCCSVMIINHLSKFKRRFADTAKDFNSSINSSIRKRVKQKHISYTLLGMNVTFFLLTLPFEVYKIYFFYNTPRSSDPNFGLIRVVDKLLNIIMYTNNATNWLFYFMLGKRFRQNMTALIWRRYQINCGSIVLTIRRFNTSIRSNRRTKTTPVQDVTRKRVKRHKSPVEDNVSIAASPPKFHCSYPAARNTFPKFY